MINSTAYCLTGAAEGNSIAAAAAAVLEYGSVAAVAAAVTAAAATAAGGGDILSVGHSAAAFVLDTAVQVSAADGFIVA